MDDFVCGPECIFNLEDRASAPNPAGVRDLATSLGVKRSLIIYYLCSQTFWGFDFSEASRSCRNIQTRMTDKPSPGTASGVIKMASAWNCPCCSINWQRV